MNDKLAEQHEPAPQVPLNTGADESAAPHHNAAEKWNCEQAHCLLEEAKALTLYISRHGDSLPDEKDKLHENLLKAIADIAACRSPDNWKKLMCAYAKLTAVTYKGRGVNGRTILDTQAEKFTWRRLFSPRNRAMAIGLIFFVLRCFWRS